jgi:hypothetical protein
VKCSRCGNVLEGPGFAVTYVSDTTTYTATMHSHCVDELVGAANRRKLQIAAVDSGWRQLGMPGYGL